MEKKRYFIAVNKDGMIFGVGTNEQQAKKELNAYGADVYGGEGEQIPQNWQDDFEIIEAEFEVGLDQIDANTSYVEV